MHIENFILWTNHDKFDHWALALWSYFPTPEFEILYSYIPYLYATRTPFCKPRSWNSQLFYLYFTLLKSSSSSEKPLTGVWIGDGTLLENLLFPQVKSTSRWGDNECQLTEQDRNLLPLFMFNRSHIFVFIGGRIQNQIREKLNEE